MEVKTWEVLAQDRNAWTIFIRNRSTHASMENKCLIEYHDGDDDDDDGGGGGAGGGDDEKHISVFIKANIVYLSQTSQTEHGGGGT